MVSYRWKAFPPDSFKPQRFYRRPRREVAGFFAHSSLDWADRFGHWIDGGGAPSLRGTDAMHWLICGWKASAPCGLIASDSLLNHGGPLGLGLFELRITRMKRIAGAQAANLLITVKFSPHGGFQVIADPHPGIPHLTQTGKYVLNATHAVALHENANRSRDLSLI